MTELRYLPDADGTTTFTATIAEAGPDAIVLDGTYFYPVGGGQPADRGSLEWDGGSARVVDVRKDHGEVRHEVASIVGEHPESGTTVTGRVDADRRRRLSRMHTAQHVLSRAVLDEYGAETAGNQIHTDRSRVDFEPADFEASDLREIERRTNEVLERDLAVTKENRPRDVVEASVPEGRGLLERIPDHVDPLRVVEIGRFDACPCGGTHVDSLGEVGRVEITDRTSKGAAVDRIEFELRDR